MLWLIPQFFCGCTLTKASVFHKSCFSLVSETLLPTHSQSQPPPKRHRGLDAGEERSVWPLPYCLLISLSSWRPCPPQKIAGVPMPWHQGYHIWSSHISNINRWEKNQHSMDSTWRQNILKLEETTGNTRVLFKWVTKLRAIWKKRRYILYCLLYKEEEKIRIYVCYFNVKTYR